MVRWPRISRAPNLTVQNEERESPIKCVVSTEQPCPTPLLAAPPPPPPHQPEESWLRPWFKISTVPVNKAGSVDFLEMELLVPAFISRRALQRALLCWCNMLLKKISPILSRFKISFGRMTLTFGLIGTAFTLTFGCIEMEIKLIPFTLKFRLHRNRMYRKSDCHIHLHLQPYQERIQVQTLLHVPKGRSYDFNSGKTDRLRQELTPAPHACFEAPLSYSNSMLRIWQGSPGFSSRVDSGRPAVSPDGRSQKSEDDFSPQVSIARRVRSLLKAQIHCFQCLTALVQGFAAQWYLKLTMDNRGVDQKKFFPDLLISNFLHPPIKNLESKFLSSDKENHTHTQYLLLAAVIFLVICLVKKTLIDPMYHWQRLGVKVHSSWLPYFGHMWGCWRKELFLQDYDAVQEMGNFYGYYEGSNPVLVVADPDIIKELMITKFEEFTDRRTPFSPMPKYFRKFIFWQCGEEWRTMRHAMSPFFTKAKVRQMFSVMNLCADSMVQKILQKVRPEGAELDVKSTAVCLTMDTITRCVYGIRVPGLDDPRHEVIKHSSLFNQHVESPAVMLVAKYPGLAALLCRVLPNFMGFGNLDFFMKLGRTVLTQKDAGSKSDSVEYMEMLLKLQKLERETGTLEKNKDKEQTNRTPTFGQEHVMTEEMVIAQTDDEDLFLRLICFGPQISLTLGSGAIRRDGSRLHQPATATYSLSKTQSLFPYRAFLLVLAGYETTSSAVAGAMFSLASKPECQEKLYQELKEKLVKNTHKTEDKDVSLQETLAECPYLANVVKEALRMYPPLFRLERVASRNTELGGVPLQKGTLVIVPTYCIHRSSENYDNPDVFDPDRWNEKEQRPFTWIPFGVGPRYCMGTLFGTENLKVILAKWVLNFRIEKCPKTPEAFDCAFNPISLNPRNIVLKFIPRVV
ncbi:unnamed protein product [Cyprideis torosa]|uniref:Uncharacterized protein n=1 Tax=Cyprideis torosa TaxID=163714 RepID=A0A7R8W7U1_9CRUS|nr:unnamed protein product [Cyprideis torosa]CAG0887911.1 unnamed protein product [Cyprideis torosa]